jgi:hypothetical protein
MDRFLELLLAVLLFAACRPSRAHITVAPSLPAEEKPPISSARVPIATCELITKEEVGAVQSTTISDTKSSKGSDGNYLVTQCYYAATGPNLSVSLAVTQRDPRNPSAPSPRDQWEQTFGPYRLTGEKETEREGEGKGKEEEEKTIPPKKVDGVGEEAFWAGNRVGGALYVLKGDVFFRISVGGPGDESVKLERSKQLAQKALGRVP